jgi:hypothetical protein
VFSAAGFRLRKNRDATNFATLFFTKTSELTQKDETLLRVSKKESFKKKK